MSIFKCKMCGGTIEFSEGASVGVCDYCGTKQTLPRLDNDKKANLYDRANHFRRNNDFDKAMSIYEQILNEDSTDAEAYWSLVLCRYGIEYVEDPQSHRRVPTVNRAQFTSVFADEDYKSALQYADANQREIYENEAKEIDDIQKGILAISQKEKPFDVFICYKETDANGRRTQDSVLANDLYHQLTQEGFKVFFSRITLEDKLGTAYEPYIFAALNSAKVMVVLGTRPEYFNAVWVRNEWSRYLALVKNSGGKKILIPAYKDMDPYDLPEEFSHLQAQDMSKLGFMQDLIRGIKKIIGASEQKATVKETLVVNAGSGNTAPLLKRVFMFLEDGNWQEADEYCEKVLDIDPECAEAYLGKLMAEKNISRRESLASCNEPFDTDNNYQKAIRFGDEKLKAELSGYINQIKVRNENARLTGIYNNAQATMRNARCVQDYRNAARVFKSISDFMDSAKLAEHCKAKAEEARKDAIYNDARSKMTSKRKATLNEAIKLFQTISGWRDADERICACQRKIEEAAREEAERLARAKEQAKKRKKKFAIGTPIVCACIVFLIVLNTVIIPSVKYSSAMKLYNAGNIVEAYEALIALDGYKDSADKANSILDKYKVEKLKATNVGDTIFFGVYEQDYNIIGGKEDIEWQVLAKEGNKILVISKYALDCRCYNSSYADITWETCSLRNWMNRTFFNNAFSTEEQSKIQNTTVSAGKNPEHNSVDPGNVTIDKMFLLSIDEVKEYFFNDSARRCAPTAYAAQGAHTNERYKTANGEATCYWWLRSPGSLRYNAAYVTDDGSVDYYGDYVSAYICVRPAMWIDLDS